MSNSPKIVTMNSALGCLVALFTLSHLELVAGLNLVRRDTSSGRFMSAAAVAAGSDEAYEVGTAADQSPQHQQSSYDLLDRNLVIACTNRHNCEMICARAKVAKFATKSALLDALSSSLGEDTLTDAHKLGIQFGRRKSCDKCALIYSNCDNQLYQTARQQLFAWRSTPDDVISLPKSSNTL